MIFFYSGTDREKARAALNQDLEKHTKKGASIVRITDANSSDDLRSAFQGGGMFEETRTIVFDSILANEEMYALFFEALPTLAKSPQLFFILEGKLDADTRKRIEKHAEKTVKFDAPGKGRDGSIFGMANALRRADKRALWLEYQRQLTEGVAPEAIHGVLFWGAKDLFMKARDDATSARGKRLIAALAELPHEARRRGEDLEYALERFVLSGV